MYLIEDNIKSLQTLCKKYKVKNLYVFGSILTERFNAESDVDLLFNFEPGMDYTTYSENYFGLWDDLKELFQRDVDLVDESSLKNPYFIEEVEETRQLIYGQTS